jgi:hypothetical protein
VFRKLLLSLGGKWLGGELRAMAEGKRGDFTKSTYWWLEGKKRILGGVMGAMSVALLSLGYGEAATVLGTLGGIAVGAGLLDNAWRTRPTWSSSPVWVLVRDHAADVTAVLGLAATALTTCTSSTAALLAHVHLTCASGIPVVTAITAVFLWAMGEAKMAMPPRL